MCDHKHYSILQFSVSYTHAVDFESFDSVLILDNLWGALVQIIRLDMGLNINCKP